MRNTQGGLDLHVGNVLSDLIAEFTVGSGKTGAKGYQTIKNVDAYYSTFGSQQAGLNGKGTLGLVFKKANPIFAILAALPPTLITFAASGGGPLVDEAFTAAAAADRFAKALNWSTGADPLVLDLGGNGLNTTGLEGSSVHFDLNGDYFSERTGWLGAGAGFLALDKNGNGTIDDASELFGSFTGSGFADLAAYDDNHDGVINASDAIWSKLLVWQDLNGDGVSTADELQGLDALGITSIGLSATALGGTTAQGAMLRAGGAFTRADGSTGAVYEAIFQTDQTDTVYRGESGTPSWAAGVGAGGVINTKGFGRVTNLAVATANDFDLAALVQARAAAMTTPDLTTLYNQVGDVLGAWGESLNLTRELTPVLLSADGATLLDRAVYTEDATGGYWTLKSGAPILAADGSTLSRPTMEQVLAQGVRAGASGGSGSAVAANGAHWQLEQAWSPSSRGSAVQYRANAPYLTQVVNGRAVILDYGIQNIDGSWRLASGNPVVDANGALIAAPTLNDILAQGVRAGASGGSGSAVAPTGEAWRTEALGFNPLANIPVANIGIDFVNGNVVDYTVQVTDSVRARASVGRARAVASAWREAPFHFGGAANKGRPTYNQIGYIKNHDKTTQHKSVRSRHAHNALRPMRDSSRPRRGPGMDQRRSRQDANLARLYAGGARCGRWMTSICWGETA